MILLKFYMIRLKNCYVPVAMKVDDQGKPLLNVESIEPYTDVYEPYIKQHGGVGYTYVTYAPEKAARGKIRITEKQARLIDSQMIYSSNQEPVYGCLFGAFGKYHPAIYEYTEDWQEYLDFDMTEDDIRVFSSDVKIGDTVRVRAYSALQDSGIRTVTDVVCGIRRVHQGYYYETQSGLTTIVYGKQQWVTTVVPGELPLTWGR